ncbi:hypothetical protein [Ponticaulis profundi]|uniref:Coil containing protein n=1 Tax=Ponticaulis profundi TaxID=2665222 RepID=A0ABW1S8L4_9PROT
MTLNLEPIKARAAELDVYLQKRRKRSGWSDIIHALDGIEHELVEADIELIPALIAEVERLRKKLDMAEAKICDCDGMFDPNEFYGDLGDSHQALGGTNES